MAVAVVLLAAGKGRRMGSGLPKVLHEIAGAPIIWHALHSAAPLEPDRTVVVAGHGADKVKAKLSELGIDADLAIQEEQLGTGHAAMAAMPTLDGFDGNIVILYGDTPFIKPSTLEKLVQIRLDGAELAFLGFKALDPSGYGRIVQDDLGQALRVVESKNADADEKKIDLCFGGIVCAHSTTLRRLLNEIKVDEVSKEYYLTEIVELASEHGMRCDAIQCDESETLGVNSRAQLAEAEAMYQDSARGRALGDGTTLLAPETVYFSYDTVLGRDTVIEPNVFFGRGVKVGEGSRIRAFSHLEECEVGPGCVIGPFARLRPGAEICKGAFIGNYVEVKASKIGAGSKVRHLSFVGDADVGERTNIGAGTITCNYDGVSKHRTKIGDRAFIGSDTILIAPVRVGDEAMTAAGSTITSDVPDGALSLARARQANKPGLARRIMSKLRSASKS